MEFPKTTEFDWINCNSFKELIASLEERMTLWDITDLLELAIQPWEIKQLQASFIIKIDKKELFLFLQELLSTSKEIKMEEIKEFIRANPSPHGYERM
ncbi:MAG: hypothetical protein ABI721_01380 [Candidatus Dojkabacteria bacterium]